MKKAIVLSIMLALALTGCGVKAPSAAKVIKPEEAQAKITEYVNKVLLAGAGYEATINGVTEDNNLYKVAITVKGQSFDSYVTKDGTLFFPQVYKVEIPATSTAPEQAAAPAIQEVNKKTAKPSVEIFVMSHCPYGTQIEKGILPAIDVLKGKVDFTVKFCDYAMHGQTELNEEMRQYCIQKNEPKLYENYLKCFLVAGKSDDCVKTTKVNVTKLASCVAATDKTYKVTAGFNDKTTWSKDQSGNPAFPQFNVFKVENDKYGVQGSPTLVINGEVISSGRDAASLLKTICSAFTAQPGECQSSLSSQTPSSGFGMDASASGSDAASCATPAQQ